MAYSQKIVSRPQFTFYNNGTLIHSESLSKVQAWIAGLKGTELHLNENDLVASAITHLSSGKCLFKYPNKVGLENLMRLVELDMQWGSTGLTDNVEPMLEAYHMEELINHPIYGPKIPLVLTFSNRMFREIIDRQTGRDIEKIKSLAYGKDGPYREACDEIIEGRDHKYPAYQSFGYLNQPNFTFGNTNYDLTQSMNTFTCCSSCLSGSTIAAYARTSASVSDEGSLNPHICSTDIAMYKKTPASVSDEGSLNPHINND